MLSPTRSAITRSIKTLSAPKWPVDTKKPATIETMGPSMTAMGKIAQYPYVISVAVRAADAVGIIEEINLALPGARTSYATMKT